MTTRDHGRRTSRLAIAARLPLLPQIPTETARELAHAFIGLTDIRPDDAADALPCRLDRGVLLDEAGMPAPGAPQLRLRGRVLTVMGILIDFDRPLSWTEGGAEYCAGATVMSEAFEMLSAAVDARPGDLLGAMGRLGDTSFSGPLVMTRDGIRWVPAALSAREAADPHETCRVSRIPARLVGALEGGEAGSHAAIDRKGLRRHVRWESMRRVRPSTRRILRDDRLSEAS